MSRGRKLTTEVLQQAAVDRRKGLSWKKLSEKYKCAVNTMRFSLAEYCDEFLPNTQPRRTDTQTQLDTVQSEIDKIKKALRKRFNLHV